MVSSLYIDLFKSHVVTCFTCYHVPCHQALCLKLLLREHIWSAPFLLVRMLSSSSYSLYASKQALDTPIYTVTITIYTVFNLFLDSYNGFYLPAGHHPSAGHHN